MRFRLLRLRLRRSWRARGRRLGSTGANASSALEKHLLSRFDRLSVVRRFVIGWVGLLLILIVGLVGQNIWLSRYFQTLRPVPGGIWSEGMPGTFTNANPLYATSDVDTSVSRLVFAGLFTYDAHNRLIGDLASGYQVDSRGTTYTVHLKPGLTWQDGQPLTSADVLFTYHLIQNPDAQSPLQSSWQGVTITAPDAQTVIFKLPGSLASFPYNLTTGLIPRHLLANVPPVNLRSADFNTAHPVGAGPFSWQAINVIGTDPAAAEEQIALAPFARYQGGEPKLHQFIVHIYASKNQLADAFKAGRLNGVEGLNNASSGSSPHNLLLSAATYVFFKTSSGPLSDKNVRQALAQATDTKSVLESLGYPTHAVREPLLMGQLGYDRSLTQPAFNPGAAAKLLDSDGWVKGTDGYRSKNGHRLSFTLTASDTPEYRSVTGQLQKQWRTLGVQLKLQFLDPAAFQNILAYHSYDAVLHGISIGPDPDVFVYWDSSQADIRSTSRLNLSEWKNSTADAALEAGRTRLNPTLRTIKYKPFLQAWQQDVPAVGLYQPRLLYLTNGPLYGLSDHTINTAADRFNNVGNWEIREARVTN